MTLRQQLTAAVFLSVFLPFSSAIAETDTASFVGKYKISRYEQVAGGLSDERSAQASIGAEIVICESQFSMPLSSASLAVDSPSYLVTEEKLYKGEGIVQRKDSSFFYGYFGERDSIVRLSVLDDAKEIRAQFEIISHETLLFFGDGRIFLAERAGECD